MHCNATSFSFQINLGIYFNDSNHEFSILVDRATGGASIEDGEIELMLHRFSCCISFATITIMKLCQIQVYPRSSIYT